MIDTKLAITKLYQWQANDYFAKPEWEARGLIPSPDDVREAMHAAKNALISALLDAIHSNADEEQLLLIALAHFRACRKARFDTEETEFLADCITQIAASMDLKDFFDRSEQQMLADME